jgi:hypothetical protein
MSSDPYVDAALFLAMHSSHEPTRVACKSFFVEQLCGGVTMSQEQVGRCDELVWGFSRTVQAAYYPFMDTLQTDMDITRPGYEEADVRMALESPLLEGLEMHERLLLGMVLTHDGILHSASPRMCNRHDLPVRAPAARSELSFPRELEKLYQRSLTLRVEPDRL